MSFSTTGMIKTPLFKRTFWLLFVVGFLNIIAIKLYLYWTVWWFDMVVHFLAGATVAMTAMLLWYFFFKGTIPNISKSIKISVAAALLIGILWEFYELYFSITFLSDGLAYWTDTSSDLLMDISGGILGALYAHRILSRD